MITDEYIEETTKVNINDSDEVLEVKLPCLTHKQWDGYNYIEKKSIIYEELKLN